VHTAKAAIVRRLRDPDRYLRAGDVPTYRDDDQTGR
jgi:hypothetical protein